MEMNTHRPHFESLDARTCRAAGSDNRFPGISEIRRSLTALP